MVWCSIHGTSATRSEIATGREHHPRCALHVAETAPLISPIHRDLDGMREDVRRGQDRHYATRHWPPPMTDKVGRAIRICDLAQHLDELEPQIERLCAHHDALRAGFGQPPVDARLLADLRTLQGGPPYAKGVVTLNKRAKRGDRMFEGAGALLIRRHLSVRHQLNTVAGTASSGTGLGPKGAGFVLGIVKALTRASAPARFRRSRTTRSARRSARRGHEVRHQIPAATPRGWFDAVLVRQSAAVSGIPELRSPSSAISWMPTRSRSAPAICWTAKVRLSAAASAGSGARVSRFTRPCPAGRKRRREPGAGPICLAQAIKYIKALRN